MTDSAGSLTRASPGDQASTPRRVLLRSHRDLRIACSPTVIAQKNLIGDNSGNTIFTHAVHRVLSTADTTIDVDLNRARPDSAARINETYDQYVLPFANAFRPPFIKRLEKYAALIEQLTIPVVIVGVGVQLNFAGDDPESLEVARPTIDRFMRAVLARSASVGLRGETTYDYLRSIGYADDELSVIGCPSLFQFGEFRVRDPLPLTRKSRVTINVSPYQPRMGPITARNTQRYPQMRYVAQDLNTLRTILYGYDPPNASDYDPQVPYRANDELLKRGRTDFFVDPTTWIDWLSNREVSFGTRIHGNIASLLAGTPAFVLAHDSRTRELAEYHEIPYRQLQTQPEDLDPRDLFETADYTNFHANQRQRLAVYKAFLDRNGVRHNLTARPADRAAIEHFDALVEAARNRRPVTSASPTRHEIRRRRDEAKQKSRAVLRKVNRAR